MDFDIEKAQFRDYLKMFWNFSFTDGAYYCCNYAFEMEQYDKTGKKFMKKMFSKSVFVTNVEELIEWSWKFRRKDCYINYNPLRTDLNRKNENVRGLSVVALDIEWSDKRKPEPPVRVQLLKSIVKKAVLFKLKPDKYMIVNSGNGIHLYMPIGKLIQKDLPVLKAAYNRFVKYINHEINIFLQSTNEDYRISMDDRKDLAGILRVPLTWNSGAHRKVEIAEYAPNGENEILRKKFFSMANKAQRQIKKQSEMRAKFDLNEVDVKLPKTIEELEAHPIVQMLFDVDLPDVDGWHQTVGFALQAVVKFSGIPYYPDIQMLEADINSTWESSISLQHCNADNPWGPLKGAYNFCKNNGFAKYTEALGKIVFRRNQQ